MVGGVVQRIFFFTTFSLCLLKVLPCQIFFCCTGWGIPRTLSEKYDIASNLSFLQSIFCKKTSLNCRSKSYFVNPISHDGYLPSLRLMFCHQIKNMSTWLSPISTIVAPVPLLLGHYKNLRLVGLWRREISHLEKEK